MINSLGETLTLLRKRAGYTQPRVSELLGERGIDIKTAGISKWEKGQTQPSAAQFLALCSLYGVTDIMAEFTDIPTPISRLNAEGRRLVADYIRVLDASGLYARAPEYRRALPLYSLAASAGTGQLLEGEDCESVPVGRDVPESARFGVRIAGDSMEPDIPDGATVWIRPCETIAPGHIGIFDYDGQSYCKRLEDGEKGPRLVSLNTSYKPILVSPEAVFHVFGEVVAVTP